MRIRAKLLILLLAIALVPLALMSHLQRRATARLGDTLAERFSGTLAADAKLQLRQVVDEYGLVLRRDRELIELALMAQAREVERCLAAGPPQPYPRVYFAHDFDMEGGAPPDMVLSPRHFTAPGSAEETPMPVSFGQQVLTLAPGVEPADAADDIARLAKMVQTYRFLSEHHAGLFFWNYTSLESGVHTAYPGHGGFPAGYDPRRQRWYKQAGRGESVIWNAPSVDASSRRILMKATIPVHHPDGSFGGVTAIDVPLKELLTRVSLPAKWASEAKVLLVNPALDPETGALGAVIVAQQDYRTRARRWDIPIELERLESGDPEKLHTMLGRMLEGKSGVQEMAYKGQHSIWASGLVHEDGAHLVVIAPYDRIVAEADEEKGHVKILTLRQLEVTSALLAGAMVLVVVVAVIASRSVTKPVRELAGTARRIAGGDLQARVKIAGRDEIGQMGRVFNEMVPLLEDNIRMRESLTLATEVQQSLLPQAAPEIEGLDVAGTSIFCDETGGDYYDFLDLSALGPDRLGVAVGDVTGHGIAAALLMATARALLRSHAIHPGTPAKLMSDINEHMTADTPVGRFMTLFYLVINAKARSIRWANAGHDPAIIYTPSTGSFAELEEAGIPLGIVAEYGYTEMGRDALEPGQLIVIGTDGIWESRNADGGRFGKEALRELIRANAHRPASEICSAITAALEAFRRSRPPEDDVTLVVIKIG